MCCANQHQLFPSTRRACPRAHLLAVACALELLASADLNVLTEAGLRALLSEKFKADLSAKQAFLKRVVKDFISNVGVHDDALTCNAHTYTVTLC